MHLKRNLAAKSWPIPRKGSAYVAVPQGKKTSIPLLVILRDLLKLTKNRREAKAALHAHQVFVNTLPVREERQGLELFDTISLPAERKHYRLTLNHSGKFALEEITESAAKEKVVKVVKKTLLKGKKMQINLSDGRNYLSELACRTHDSVIVNLEKKKIERCIPLQARGKVLVTGGKHTGKHGLLLKIEENKHVLWEDVETKEQSQIPLSKIIVLS